MQQRLALLSRDMENHNGHAVDLIDKRIQQDRPLNIVTIRRGFNEDPQAPPLTVQSLRPLFKQRKLPALVA